jgi:hypothetical protein
MNSYIYKNNSFFLSFYLSHPTKKLLSGIRQGIRQETKIAESKPRTI